MDNSFSTWKTLETKSYQTLPPTNQNSEISYLTDNQGNTFKFQSRDFIHNGQGMGIISMRVIQENENWFLEEIEELFWQKYQIVFLNWIPLIPNDKNAKIADYFHFQDSRTLQLKNIGVNEKFWQKIAKYLKKNGLRVVISA
jgi:hypothetical protein